MSLEAEQYLTKEQIEATKKAVKCQNDDDLEKIFNAECIGHLNYKMFDWERLWLWVGPNHKIVVFDQGNGHCQIISVFPIEDQIHHWGVLGKNRQWLIYMVSKEAARNTWKNNENCCRLVNHIKLNKDCHNYNIIEEKPNVY